MMWLWPTAMDVWDLISLVGHIVMVVLAAIATLGIILLCLFVHRVIQHCLKMREEQEEQEQEEQEQADAQKQKDKDMEWMHQLELDAASEEEKCNTAICSCVLCRPVDEEEKREHYQGVLSSLLTGFKVLEYSPVREDV